MRPGENLAPLHAWRGLSPCAVPHQTISYISKIQLKEKLESRTYCRGTGNCYCQYQKLAILVMKEVKQHYWRSYDYSSYMWSNYFYCPNNFFLSYSENCGVPILKRAKTLELHYNRKPQRDFSLFRNFKHILISNFFVATILSLEE